MLEAVLQQLSLCTGNEELVSKEHIRQQRITWTGVGEETSFFFMRAVADIPAENTVFIHTAEASSLKSNQPVLDWASYNAEFDFVAQIKCGTSKNWTPKDLSYFFLCGASEMNKHFKTHLDRNIREELVLAFCCSRYAKGVPEWINDIRAERPTRTYLLFVDKLFDGRSFYTPYDKISTDWTTAQLRKSTHPAVRGILDNSHGDVRAKRQKVEHARQAFDEALITNQTLVSFFGERQQHPLTAVLEAAATSGEVQNHVELVSEASRIDVQEEDHPEPPTACPAVATGAVATVSQGAAQLQVAGAPKHKAATKWEILLAIYHKSREFTHDVQRQEVRDWLDEDTLLNHGSKLRDL
jgi:hypothetical protein